VVIKEFRDHNCEEQSCARGFYDGRNSGRSGWWLVQGKYLGIYGFT
jgi:hypothetical protein